MYFISTFASIVEAPYRGGVAVRTTVPGAKMQAGCIVLAGLRFRLLAINYARI